MTYQVGDTVVHGMYGIGKVIEIEEKLLAGVPHRYYVVQIDLLKLWVPVDEAEGGSIRPPTLKSDFSRLFEILSLPGEPLPDHPYQRRLELRKRAEKRTLDGVCHVIRDLHDRLRSHTANQNDNITLKLAEERLLEEWSLSMEVAHADAQLNMQALLNQGIEAESIQEAPSL